jgi:translation initiation factor IF-3
MLDWSCSVEIKERFKRNILRHNNQIRGVPVVNVIDETGRNLGMFSIKDAMRISTERGLDLVEVNPNSNPPSCRIMNFGQFKYEQKKNKKPQKADLLKEIEVSVGIGAHDLGFKCDHIRDWLSDGHKVMVKLRFKGRQITHSSLGFEQMDKVLTLLDPKAFVLENKPALNGKLLTMILRPTNNQQS